MGLYYDLMEDKTKIPRGTIADAFFLFYFFLSVKNILEIF